MTPTLTFLSASATKLSNVTGKKTCTVSYSCDIDLQQFQARATRVGDPRGVGVGDLVFSDTNITAGSPITFSISSSSITQGDGEYVISLWGRAIDGYIDFGNVDFDNINFGDSGSWNS